jgi:hypothetical protein
LPKRYVLCPSLPEYGERLTTPSEGADSDAAPCQADSKELRRKSNEKFLAVLYYATKNHLCKAHRDFTVYEGDVIVAAMETIKTATFEALLENAVPDGEDGFVFTLDGETFKIKDTLEITGIATKKGYIIIY